MFQTEQLAALLSTELRRIPLPRTFVNNPTTHLAAYYLYAQISAVRREKEKEVTLVRRIILLMTVAALVVVSTLFAVSVAGAHKHPTAKSQKHPTRTVLIKNFSFKPANITIKRGTKVRWINKDSTAHTATANNKRSFDSGRLSKGQSYTHTFKSAGKKPYHCEIHPDMKGRITVKR